MAASRFDMNRENQWCPGCGNFGVLKAMKDAFEGLDLFPEDLLLVGGIGQSGKTVGYLAGNMLHALHGRALPLATGAKIANQDLTVIISAGDGDSYGEGGNHLVSAIRRNIDITLLVHNNQIYGLTKGQASPTSSLGMTTKAQPQGVTSTAFNPIAMALSAGIGFVAQGFSGDTDQLTRLIKQAISHKGFSMVDIFQPCVSFNRINTFHWYKERVYDLADTGHDTSDLGKAFALSQTDAAAIPTGVIYERQAPDFHQRQGVLKNRGLRDYRFSKEKMNDILGKA